MIEAATPSKQLRDYVLVLRRRKWTVILAVVVVVGVALTLSFLQTPVYRASSRVLFQPTQALFSGIATEAVVTTEMEVMRSAPVVDQVRRKLTKEPPAVSTAQVGATSVVEVSVESTSPKEAVEFTNAYVDAYLAFRRKQGVDEVAGLGQEVKRQIDSLQKDIDGLSERMAGLPACTGANPPASCSERSSLETDRDALVTRQAPLQQKYDGLLLDASRTTSGAQVIAPAPLPTAPVRPTPLRNGILAGGVGLIIGIALALAFDHLDDSIKTSEDLERAVPDLSVLGVIPTVSSWRNRQEGRVVTLSEPGSPPAEAYRTLRTSIQFLRLDRSLRVLQVTSPGVAEGKSTTTANLAVALFQAGLSVAVIDCDLRRPRLRTFFADSNPNGFTSVLLGESPVSAALGPVRGEQRLRLMNAGPLPPNPSELLSARRAVEVLKVVGGSCDIVLVDCPPVLPVTDAAVLSSLVDGTLLVAAAGVTTQKQVSQAVRTLRQVGATLVGVVLNGVAGQDGYGYAYRYYRADPATNGQEPIRQVDAWWSSLSGRHKGAARGRPTER